MPDVPLFAAAGKGLNTLVHFLAQLKRFKWDMGCV